jgi:hypothetical protein
MWRALVFVADFMARGTGIPELPDNRTYRRHGPNGENDPTRTSMEVSSLTPFALS